MTDADLTSFMGVLGRMGTVFSKREADLETMAPVYFRALQRFAYADVARAAEHLVTVEPHFPRPARWIAAIGETRKSDPLPALTGRAAAEHLEAQRQGFEGSPCGCEECLVAGVVDRPVRFVPVEPHARVVLGLQSTIRGRWIHGWELARWYEARANCYEVMHRLAAGHPVRELLEALP